MSDLKLFLLGPPRAELDGQPADLRRRKVLALLIYLAVTGQPHTRDALATLFWPDHTQRRARAYLRRDLAILNTSLAGEWLEADRETIQLKRGSDPSTPSGQVFWLDVAHFNSLLAACRTHGHPPDEVCFDCLPLLNEAVTSYTDDFLAGFTLSDSAEFDDWQFFQTESLRQELASALERLVRGHSAQGDYEAAIRCARRWTSLDPLHEPAQRSLIYLYDQSGQPAAALRQYEEYTAILEKELGFPPEEETTTLYEAIKAKRRLAPHIKAARQASPAAARQGTAVFQTASSPDSSAIIKPATPHYESTPPSSISLDGVVAPEAEESIFVARQQELAQLDSFLDAALAGHNRVLFVIGEAGQGKTALVQAFAQRAQQAIPNLVVAGGNCNAYTGMGDPYLPFREILDLLTGDVEAQAAAGTLRRDHARHLWQILPVAAEALLEAGPDLVGTFIPGQRLLDRAATFAPEGANWLTRLQELANSKAERPGVANLPQSDLFEQYVKVVQALARHVPLLLWLDDLQWADLGSTSLLFHLGRQLAGYPVLIVGAFRPAEVALGRGGERHPLEWVVNEFQRQFGDIVIDLRRADGHQFVQAILDIEPNQLSPAFLEALYQHTKGHALFTVEMLRGLQERGDLVRDEQGRWVEGTTLNWEILPARIEGVIGERVGRLPSGLQEALKVASVEGEVFTAEVVAHVQNIDERDMIRQLSGQLDKQHRLVRGQDSQRLGKQRLSHYRFGHILFQRYLYNSLDEVELGYLHEAVGIELERLYGQHTEDIALELARHFEKAGLVTRAIDYLHQAGNRTVRLSANEEAIGHFNRGLALLDSLPETMERHRQELNLQIALFAPLAGARGYGARELGEAYTRARELGEKVGDPHQLFLVLYGLWGHNLVRSELRTSQKLAEECLTLAHEVAVPAFLMEAHRMTDETAFYRGEFASARTHFEQSLALYDRYEHRAHAAIYGQDPGVALLSHGCCILWHLGYPDQALERSKEAIALAEEQTHPFSLAFALCYSAMLHQYRREEQAVQELAEAAINLSTEQGFVFWLAQASFLRAWALVGQGQAAEGISAMRQSLDDWRAIGTEFLVAYTSALLAEAYAKAGQLDEGLALLEEALKVIDAKDQGLYEAELHRLKGEFLLMRGGAEAEVEEDFCKAIEVARRRSAKSQELRATMSLTRLWQRQGKLAEARSMLAEIYGWFTEGFDTSDLKQAKVLLQELADDANSETRVPYASAVSSA
jgi:predicted ATPase/DNA-binding SARP family transcriptional activator